MSTAIGIPNKGAMNEFIGEFDATSRLTNRTYHCQFSHLWNGVATRHSDTVDAKFLVDGVGTIVGLSHPGIARFRQQSGRDLTDRELSYVAAQYLREQLEQEDERLLYDCSEANLLRIIGMLGIK